MGEWSGFFPSSGGDRKYKTAHIAAITDALFHSGVCQNDDLTLAPAGAMTAALGAGRALVNGYHYQNDSPLTLTFGYADGTLARSDAVNAAAGCQFPRHPRRCCTRYACHQSDGPRLHP